jgi:uncharacterized membrane protein YagU involved in acid resistance
MTTPFPFASSKPSLTTPQAILWGGLIAGVLDAIDGVVAFGFKGLNPIQVLQYIASGFLGKAAFDGGLGAAGLGAISHFFIAFVVAAVYVFAGKQMKALNTKPVPYGLAYGVSVYLVMNYIVLPVSNVAPSPFSLALFLNGVIGHALFVGLPIALYSRRVAA